MKHTLTLLAALLLAPLAALHAAETASQPLMGSATEADAAFAEPAKPWAILIDNISGLDAPAAERLTGGLIAAGHSVEPLGVAALTDPAAFNTQRFEGLLLTASPRFPVCAFSNITRFLGSGGDLVLLGGRAFSEPVAWHDGSWKTKEEIAEAIRRDSGEGGVLFDFDSGNLSAWRRSAQNAQSPSSISMDVGKKGNALRMELRDVGWWDVYERTLDQEIPQQHDALSFWVTAVQDSCYCTG